MKVERNDKEVLLQIHRQFTKDEAVQALEKEVAAVKYELGVMKSENQELENEVKVLETKLAQFNEQNEETPFIKKSDLTPEQKQTIALDSRITQLKHQFHCCTVQRKKLEIDLDRWRNKAIQLELKTQSNQ